MRLLFRAEQIGSLIRPSSLVSARDKSNASTYSSLDQSSEDVKSLTGSAIRVALAQQLQRRIRPLTNSEYPRHIFYAGFFEAPDGMEVLPSPPIPEGFRRDFPTIETLQKLGIKTRPAVVSIGSPCTDEQVKNEDSVYSNYKEKKLFIHEVGPGN